MTSRLLGVALLLGTLPAIGQSQTKKPLTQADWDRWRSITAPTLSPDGKWAAYTLTPQVGDGEFVVRSTRVSFVLIKLADGTQSTSEGRNPRFPKDNGKWMLYSLGADSSATDAAGGGRGGRGGGGRGGAAPAGGRRQYGSEVVLRNMDSGAEDRLADVSSSIFDDSAKVLAYTVTSHDSTKDGVFIRNLGAGSTQTVLTGQGNYRGLAFDHAQQQFTFASDKDDFGKDHARSTIYVGAVRTGQATPAITPAMWPNDVRVPDNGGAPQFTRAGNAIVFQLGTLPEDTIPADSLTGKAVFDLWNYKDPDLQPTQKLRLAQDRNKTYQSIFNLTTKKIVQLAGDTITNVQLSDDAKVGVATSGVKYSIESMWHPGQSDVYLVDPATGSHRIIAERVKGQAQLSVEGKYVTYYNDQHWFVYNVATAKTVDVSAPLKGVHFEQETWSTPDEPNAWGIAGWTKGDKSLLINDRFDIWEIDPNGLKQAVVVTDSVGRKKNITFRIINLGRDPEERAIDPAKPLWLHAFSEATKASGFYRGQLGVTKLPEEILMCPYAYGTPTKSKDAEMFMYTRSTASEFPNLWVGPGIRNVQKVSDADPWQSDYNWVTSELVTWTSDDGVPLQGILYKPENFDPTKKYPMVSYFYEDLSNGLYNYLPPTGRNIINLTHYASNRHLVFEPDIHYETGHPGQSALKSIVPGVQMLVAKGFVDSKHMGLQGQSWGGYQTAYMITQTHMFAAAMAGAPVANMTSAYGGISWGARRDP